MKQINVHDNVILSILCIFKKYFTSVLKLQLNAFIRVEWDINMLCWHGGYLLTGSYYYYTPGTNYLKLTVYHKY